MSRIQHLIEQIAPIIAQGAMNQPDTTAKYVIERLMDEGVITIGYGDKDVDRIIDQFKQSFGTTKASKHDRWSANRLAAKYGAQAVTGIIQLLAKGAGEKYAPVVGNVAQLEDKWVSVLNFVRKQQEDKAVDI